MAPSRRARASTVGLPGFGRQVDQHLASRGGGAPQPLRHIRRGAAAECAHVERSQLRVGHHQANRVRRGVELFGDDLRQRRADVLADLGLAGVNA